MGIVEGVVRRRWWRREWEMPRVEGVRRIQGLDMATSLVILMGRVLGW